MQPALVEDFEGLPEVAFSDGQTVYAEGERHGDLLVLVSGAVRVSAKGAEISTIDSPGALFGEMAMLLDAPATATVVSIGESRFLRAEDPFALLRLRPQIALGIAVTLARRLDLITQYLADLRNQYADRSDHLGVVDTVLESLLQKQGTSVEPGSERQPDAPY